MKFRFSPLSTRFLMMASALFLAIIGIIATFAPELILRFLDNAPSDAVLLIVQILGALYLGFAALNWMARENLIGGIYSKPLVVANLMHFMVGGLAIIKVVAVTPALQPLWPLALIYAVFAIAFGLVMNRHPVASKPAVIALLMVSALAGCATSQPEVATSPARDVVITSPLVIGETFTMPSATLGETRRINVWKPSIYNDSAALRLPVLYMPDGGVEEDFQHIAGLLHISILNGSMRPFMLVGIENTERRRDLTGPTQNDEDRKIAPRVGGSAAFRTFIRTELMPLINERYRTTSETAIIGESLAGLFVVETLLRDPDLFDTYIAFDPSIWWNNSAFLTRDGLHARSGSRAKTLFLASSSDDKEKTIERFAGMVRAATGNVVVHYIAMPAETHGTIYHPAALMALRALFPIRGTL